MLDVNGFVSTCNSTNFFMVKDRIVYTSTGQYCMNGITRQKIIEVCKANNIEVREVNFSLFDVYGADEAFVTGTFAGIIPVSKIEDRNLKSTSSDSLVNQIRFLYNKHIQENIN